MKTKIPQLAHLSLATLALGLMFAPNAQAAIWFDNEAGDLDFGNATNWNTNQLPSVGGNGNAFIGASGGAGGTAYAVTYTGTMTTSAELQVGTEANAYGAQGNPGGEASLTLNSGANLTVSGALVVGQGRDNTNDNSGTLTVNSGAALTVNGTRAFLGFYDNDNLGATAGTLTVDGGTFTHTGGTNRRLIIGGWDTNQTNNYGRGFMNIEAGTVNLVSMVVGAGRGEGAVTQNGGDVNLSGFFTTGLGITGDKDARGTYTMNGGTLDVAGAFSVHESNTVAASSSTFTQTGGTVTANDIAVIGRSAIGQGIYDISGGSFNVTQENLRIGGVQTGATGVLNISGSGAVVVGATTPASSLVVGSSDSSTGTVNQTGGTLTLQSASTSGVLLGAGANSTATYNLDGGTLITPDITLGDATATKAFNFGGGTLQANGSFTVATDANFTTAINAGGGTIDTNGFDVTWNPNLTGAGALTKSGTGTLNLNGTNTYNGGTTLDDGKIRVNNNESIGTGTLTFNGGTLSGANTGSTITLNEAMVVNGSVAVVNESNTGGTAFTLSGDISGAGTLNLGGSGNGQGNRQVVIADNLDGFTGTVSWEGVGGGNSVVVTAAVNTTAALETSGVGTGAFDFYLQNNVTFGELSGTGGIIKAQNKTLTIDQDTNTTYAGVLANANGSNPLRFTKDGTGTLTLSGANTYTGTTTVSAGTLSLATGYTHTGSGTYTVGTDGTAATLKIAHLVDVSSHTMTIGLGGVISPGNSPGTAITGDQTWNDGGSYLWEINNSNGTKGVDEGWDWLDIQGDLTLTGLTNFTIDITSLTTANDPGLAAGFDYSGLAYGDPFGTTFIIASAFNIIDFDATAFVLDDSAFVNGKLDWSIIESGTDLVLTAVFVPEPSSTALLGLGLSTLLLRRRR